MQFHLSRYAYLLESSLLSDAVTLVPKESSESLGLKAIMESIDNRADFKAYVQNYRIVHQGSGRGPRREGPAEQGFVRIHYHFQLFTYTLPVTSSRSLYTTLTD
jgi:hypothetical protein